MKLVLFDIDGTILNTGASGVKTLDKVIYEKYGKKAVYDIQNIVGMPDKHNFAYMYEATFNKKPTTKIMQDLLKAYIAALPGEIKEQIKNKKYRLITGIENFLKELSKHKDIVLGLATGNSEEAARIKLEPAKLNKYFTTGGFGWCATNRAEMLAKGVKNASKKYKYNFKPEEVFIIGDTQHDVMAAKENGYHSAVVLEATLAPKDKLLRAAAELEAKDFTDIKLWYMWLGLTADPKGVKKGSYIMPASAIEHVFFSRTGIDEESLKKFRIKKYEDLESGTLW